MIVFENDGELDIRLLTSFGCSVKESKSPIGFFGTGLKFAVAVLLRQHHSIVIQIGIRSITVTLKTESVRGKDFSFVCFSGEQSGFTTELGKTWETWMAYRELYCNANDEPNACIYETDEEPPAQSGKTRFIVGGDKITESHRNRDEFILSGSPDEVAGDIEIYRRKSMGFFYKGIKVANFKTPALFTYNQKSHLALTEDRTVKEQSSVLYNISRAILEHGSVPILEAVLVAGIDSYEHLLDFHGWGVNPSAHFFQTVEQLQRSSLMNVNQTALRLWREKGHGFISPRRKNLTTVQAAMLERAITFCEKSGFDLRDQYPIIVCETIGGGGAMAACDIQGKQIFLAEAIFDQGGTKGVARALIEEYIHLRFGLKDETREMQNFIFDKMVSLAEELTGEPL